MNNVYLIRIARTGNPTKKWWAAFDGVHTVRGKVGQPRSEVLKQWAAAYGQVKKLVRFQGVSRESEAAATMASIAMEVAKATGSQPQS